MPAAKPRTRKLPALSPDELARYGRQLMLPEVGVSGQQRLKSSSVLVVGLGGLGNPAATYLAAAGVGRIGLADGDVIEKSNLQRQFLFSESQIGRSKAEVAKVRLSQVNPDVQAVSFPTRVNSSNALEVIDGFDVVVDATDNLPSRYLISDACVLSGKPDVYASAVRFDGQASVLCTSDGPCYRCLYPKPPPPESLESCEEVGVLGAVTGVMGTVQAVQVVRILLGRSSSLAGRLLLFSGQGCKFEELRIRRNPDCPTCGRSPTVKKLIDYEEFCGAKTDAGGEAFDIEPLALAESIRRGARPILLDVREPYEYEICHLEGSTLIPVGQIPGRIKELDPARATVVYCHHGIRSAGVTRILREAGFANVVNLKGGIEAWRQRVDPKMRGY